MQGLPRPRFTRATAVAVVAGVAAVATSYALVGPSPSFVVAPVEALLSRAMPGALVAAAITVLGDLGQELNLLLAAILVVTAFALGVRLAARARDRVVPGAAVQAGVVAWLVAVVLSGRPLHALAVAATVAVVVAVGDFAAAFRRVDPLSTKRRRALSTVGGALGLAAVGYQAGQFNPPSPTAAEAAGMEGPNVDRAAIDARLQEAAAAELDADAVGPLVSDQFYNVDINAIDPEPAVDTWSLSLTGAVERELTFGYEEIRAMPSEHRFATLRCVGESLNGQKIDTALWTGTPIERLVERATPHGGCGCVMLHGVDDYSVQFPIDALESGLLAYGMNGNVLPRGHGYPLRALVPGHWGEVNAKWLTEIEFLDEAADGYWEQRGWHGTGPVEPVAKLHTETTDHPDGRLVGGHAYAGTRGVSAVEVSTDGGETWAEAQLSDRLPDEDVWRQWAYTYEPPGNTHDVVVRMIDDEGTLQPREERPAFPRGPSGWVSVTYSQ